MFALHIVCLASLALVAYSYIGYPILLMAYASLLGRRRGPLPPDDVRPGEWPFVSLVIAAYREEKSILDRIHNALLMDYPADRMEVLIGCDGNEDQTGELVRTVSDSRVRLLQFPHRRGKPSVLNDCVAQARGEVIAFSDANTFYEPRALKQLVRHFRSPQVGGAVGRLVVLDPLSGKNVDGQYWRLESKLKQCEGRIGALLGANGAIYAIRKSLWQPLAANTIVDDFVIGMRVHLSGKRLLFEPAAVAVEESAPSMQAEFHRRARIGAGGFQSLVWLAPLLGPRYSTLAWAFWSHKVLRWCTPLFLATAFVTDLCLLSHPLFRMLLALQLTAYGAAMIGMVLPARSPPAKAFRMAAMFCSMNAALAVGFWRWLSNRQSGAWQRTARASELAAQKE